MSKRNLANQRHFTPLLQSKRFRASYRRRLGFEPLEDRRLLATLTVNSALDNKITGDGLVTLREAIIAANTNATTDLGEQASGTDTIVFDPTVFSGESVIALSLGELAVTESVIINGTGKDLFTIDAGQISRIFNSGEAADSVVVTLSGMTLTGGQSAGRGGAVYAKNLNATDCNFFDNAAMTGGGIYARTATLTRCTITGNTAEWHDNGYQFDGAGGGILSRFLTIKDSVISNNHADTGGGIVNPENPSITSFKSRITGTTLDGNTARQAGAAYIRGADVEFIDSVISGNSAQRNGAASGGTGGGVLASVNAFNPVRFVRTLVTGNIAEDVGGGIVGNTYLLSSTVSNNQAIGGGGISGRLTSIDSSIVDNYASTSGGAVFMSYAPVTLTSTVVTGNRAGGNGGAINVQGGTLTADRSTISGNIAGGNGGGIYSENRVVLTNSTVSGNHSGGPLGGGGINVKSYLSLVSSTISANSSVGNGGGIHVSGPAVIRHSTIAYNSSQNGAGGGIWNDAGLSSTTIAVEASILAKNTAQVSNPDLFVGKILVVSASLVGDNAGTQLLESQTLDANHNLIGSSAGAGAIDPKLAPLNSNGGSPRTHALLPGSAAIDFLHPLTTLPVHDYTFTNTLTDSLGGPMLVGLGGQVSSTGYTFAANKGLTLSSANISSGTYSIELVFKFDTFGPGWQKIIDFKNSTADAGVYSRGTGLDFLNRAFTTGLFTSGTMARLLLTRDDATDVVTAYVNGIEAWSFVDTANEAVLSGPDRIITFFKDDSVTVTEAASGFVDRIRIFNAALTAADAKTLAVVTEIPPEFDQRGTPFLRTADGDGVGGAQIDVGAYESQGVPSYSRGDYNTDGIVDLVDYTLWRNTLGTEDVEPFSGADGNGDGDITQEDYGVWKSHFGDGLTIALPAAAGSGAASPLSASAVDAAIDMVVFVPDFESKQSGKIDSRQAATIMSETRDNLLLLALTRRTALATSDEPATVVAEVYEGESAGDLVAALSNAPWSNFPFGRR